MSVPALGRARQGSDVGNLDQVTHHLALLEAEEAQARAVAQRWLSVHLTREHLPVLVEAVQGSGIEAQRRLVSALAADERHLGLCVALMEQGESEVLTLGEAAVGQMLEAWSVAVLDPAMEEGDWPELAGDGQRGFLFQPAYGGLSDALERLQRWGEGPMPIVLDPGLDPEVRGRLPFRTPRRDRTQAWAKGTIQSRWTDSLLGVLHGYQVSVTVLGWRGAGKSSTAGTQPFLLVHKARRAPQRVLDYILDWCRGVVRPHDRSWNTACARALASTGWPAAVRWLEERWLTGDEAALQGVLLAARRGRVAPGLLKAGPLAAIVLAADALAASSVQEGRLQDLARSLANLSLPRKERRELTEMLLANWESLSPSSRWVRLVIWEGQHPQSDSVAQRCHELLADPSLSAGQHRQALRTLGAVGGAWDDFPGGLNMGASLALAADQLALESWVRDCLAVGAGPPQPTEDWMASPERMASFLYWCVATGEYVHGAPILVRLLQAWGPVELALQIREWQGSGLEGALAAFLQNPQVVAAASEANVGGELERFSWHAALASPGERDQWWGRWMEATGGGQVAPPAMLVDLAVLSADPPNRGQRVRAALVEQAARGVGAKHLAGALSVAGRVLLSAGRRPEAHELRRAIEQAAGPEGDALGDLLDAPLWPRGHRPRAQLLWPRMRYLAPWLR